MVEDSVAIVLVAATGFFLALSFGLLYRYRQTSQKFNESTDLGRDLWQALEQRMNKQDERIVDLMARLEVVQARALSAPQVQTPPPSPHAPPLVSTAVPQARLAEPTQMEESEVRDVTELRPVAPVAPSPESPESQPQLEPKPEPEPEPAPEPAKTRMIKLDKTSLRALELLKKKPLTTEELWTRLERGREHTSRVMKNLFEKGLVSRDDANKPYTYQLTEEGRQLTQKN